MIFNGTSKQLHQLINEINKIHQSINLNRCQCPIQNRVAFLDTSCSIKDNKIDIDLLKVRSSRGSALQVASTAPAPLKLACSKALQRQSFAARASATALGSSPAPQLATAKAPALQLQPQTYSSPQASAAQRIPKRFASRGSKTYGPSVPRLPQASPLQLPLV